LSIATGTSFSNVVLSLSALQKFDSLPFIVVVLRPDSAEFLLANTTFLNKISHSSHELRVNNVRGSFLGHDIVREYDGIRNVPDNFQELFARHQEFSWSENLERLVETTNAIVGVGSRYEPTDLEREVILDAPCLAEHVICLPSYVAVKRELDQIVQERSGQILEYGRIDNVNQRGNLIEQTITGGINEHNLADMVRMVEGGVTLDVEIKTKLLDRASSPKAYNIDKALQTLARPKTLITFFFVGVDLSRGAVQTSLVSIFDSLVLGATRVQFHWAGRNSRGVTQLTGDLSFLFDRTFREQIDIGAAQQFLLGLLDL